MTRNILFTSLPTPGHVNPTLPLVEELVRRGHRVTYGVHPKMSRAVVSAGADLLPIDFEMPPQPASRTSGPERFAHRLALFAELIEAGFPSLLDHARAERPDAVCYDMMTPSGRMIAERLGLLGVGLLPSFASNRHTMESLLPSMASPDQSTLQPVWRTLRRMAREHRVSMSTVMMAGPPAQLNIVFLPRRFQLAGETFDDSYHFVGPDLGTRSRAGGWSPPDPSSLVLFVSLGTASHRPDLFRLCAEAFRDGAWHTVMAVGDHVDTGTLGPLPPTVEVRPFFPQPAVLRHADVFLSHTGMNSTMEALLSGVPIVALPQRPEQEVIASRVEALGLGRRLRETDLTPGILRAAVEEVHRDEGIRREVHAMRQCMRGVGGAVAAADVIEAQW
ncbi:macrolide family glycosyltransferase [Streptomyces sp. NPDC127098]|uniref:macrolide family glycosyltransferase n=1 Tax=Streptomyces sp. NPDC127098 TaxID=3347137 RepID=UPI0036565B11